MSILDSFTKKKALTAAMNQTAKARSSEGKTADSLYKGAYHDYAEVLVGDPLRSDALYHWGFALLHHAKTKTGLEAVELLEDAVAKFSFCLLLNPSYLGAAVNGGVAYMDLARIIEVDSHDTFYEQARIFFEKANAIQAGSASYNLACIHSLRDEGEACLAALKESKNRGSLPDVDEIMNDPDLDLVKEQPWFIEFIEELTPPPSPEVNVENIATATENLASTEVETKEKTAVSDVEASTSESQTSETVSDTQETTNSE